MNARSSIDLPVLAGTNAAKAFFTGQFDPDRECLWIAHVDDSARCIHLSRVEGDHCSAKLPIREILADAIQYSSSGIVLAHNHPSGDSKPSETDLRVTKRLSLAAEAIDLVILDHLVFGAGEVASFRRLGLL